MVVAELFYYSVVVTRFRKGPTFFGKEAAHEQHNLRDRFDCGGVDHSLLFRLALIADTRGPMMTPTDTLPKDTRATPVTEGVAVPVQWGPVIAGAFAAAALAFLLHSFAGAIGISLSSTAPTWRDASIALVSLSGLYLILSALAAYSFGAYVAARMRSRLSTGTPEEVEFRDGMHGLLVWALATLLTALFAIVGAQSLTPLAAPSGGASGPTTSVGGENIIAYDLDRLLRSERPAQGDLNYMRAEAARILLTTASHRGMLPEDRTYLTRLVTIRTGLAAPEAERRVDEVAVRAKENITRARKSAVIMAFAAGAATLLGAAAAWFAACAGGRLRDGGVAPALLDWGRPVRPTIAARTRRDG